MAACVDGRDLRSALAALDDVDETTVDTGLTYRGSEPVLIRIRRRGHRYDIGDNGGAVSLAGSRLDGWRGLSVWSRSRVSTSSGAASCSSPPGGRDIAALAFRLAEISRTVYLTLLEAAAA